jgi:hypothetical protein
MTRFFAVSLSCRSPRFSSATNSEPGRQGSPAVHRVALTSEDIEGQLSMSAHVSQTRSGSASASAELSTMRDFHEGESIPIRLRTCTTRPSLTAIGLFAFAPAFLIGHRFSFGRRRVRVVPPGDEFLACHGVTPGSAMVLPQGDGFTPQRDDAASRDCLRWWDGAEV